MARMIGLKSRNSLFRILDDTSGPAAQMSFYEHLIASDSVNFSDEEMAALKRALEVSRVGVEGYCTNQAMHKLLVDVSRDSEEPPLRLDRRGKLNDTLDNLFKAYTACREINMTIIGCYDRAIFETIRRCLLDVDTGCRVHIFHVFYAGDDDIIRATAAAQPLLYSPAYEAYCVMPGTFSTEREQIYRANSIAVRLVDQKGHEQVHMLSLYDYKHMLLIEQCSKDSLLAFDHMLKEDRCCMQPLQTPFELCRTAEDYLHFAEKCCKLERTRSIYNVKGDIPFSFIHPATFIAAAEDGMREAELYPEDESLMGRIFAVQKARYENFYRKNRVTHMIFSPKVMMDFARTGVQCSRFIALRPYTREERVDILSKIRRHEEENPYFNVYFFKPLFNPPKMEICLYEGAGVRLAKPNIKGMESEKGHVETLITHRAFCEKYKAFYLKELLVNQVEDKRTTLRMLDELIEMAKNS